MKLLAGLLFLLNTILFATYYAVAKEALGRIDPIIFTYLEMQILVPAALCIIALAWKDMTRAAVKRGFLLGSSLCLALFTIAIALKYTTATSTAFFPSLNGFVAALIAWFVLRQPIRKATWFAGVLSVAGAALLIATAAMDNSRGICIAFLGGIFFTVYVFLSEHERPGEYAPWAIFGVELLTMAVWASLVVLLFGNWQTIHPTLPKDAFVLLYVAGACTFLPTLIAVLMQKYISAVTVSFIYILEPLLAAFMAALYLHELLPPLGYLGGLLVVGGAVIHTWGQAASRDNRNKRLHHYSQDTTAPLPAIKRSAPERPFPQRTQQQPQPGQPFPQRTQQQPQPGQPQGIAPTIYGAVWQADPHREYPVNYEGESGTGYARRQTEPLSMRQRSPGKTSLVPLTSPGISSDPHPFPPL